MTYRRVLPRDLFNESSLLKCYGRLWILLERFHGEAKLSEDDVPSFKIEQRESDGAIYISNLQLLIGSDRYLLTRPLNSRKPWPLYAELLGDPDAEPIEVFTFMGNLSPGLWDKIFPKGKDA